MLVYANEGDRGFGGNSGVEKSAWHSMVRSNLVCVGKALVGHMHNTHFWLWWPNELGEGPVGFLTDIR